MSAEMWFGGRRAMAALWFLLLGVAPLNGSTPGPDLPSADSIFASAKGVWRVRSAPPFARYSLLERYTWRRRVHDNWWHVAYRDRDRRLSLVRLILPDQEAARMRGMSIGINYRIHNGSAHADSLETNADADAFPVLDPLVDPDASFGLSRREAQADLGGPRPYGVTLPPAGASPASPSAAPSLEPANTPAPAVEPASSTAIGNAAATEKPLRELARVEAVARDYRIALAGVERVRDEDAYHLTLVPVREPRTYRLRDLWVATNNYETLRLTVDGLFSGRPYDDARWTVSFVDFAGLAYVGQIRTEETLRFGVDRYVNGLEYDFVDYSFPANMSPLEFDRLL